MMPASVVAVTPAIFSSIVSWKLLVLRTVVGTGSPLVVPPPDAMKPATVLGPGSDEKSNAPV